MYNICIPLRATDFKLTKVFNFINFCLTFYVWPVWVTGGQLPLESLIQVPRISWFKETSQPSGRYLGNTICILSSIFLQKSLYLIYYNTNSLFHQRYFKHNTRIWLCILFDHFLLRGNHVGCSHPGLAWSGDTGYWSHALV